MDTSVKNHNIPFFVSIPHSGIQIPEEASWLKNISQDLLNCDVDFYVHELYQPALSEHQIYRVFSPWHRYAVDLNRSSDSISHLTVEGAKNTQDDFSSDVHWYKTTKGDTLISKPITQDTHKTLIEKYFKPYHDEIQKQITQLKKQHKEIYLLDLHSMPSEGLDFHKDTGRKRPDIVLGTCDKNSTKERFIKKVFNLFKQTGFDVRIDWPYKGGYITQTYGDPEKNQHVIQVEINRDIYMDEKTKNKTPEFESLQLKLQKVIASLVESLKT